MNRNPLLILLFIAVLISLSACTLNINTSINADGSGQLVTEIGLNAEDQLLLEDFDMTTEGFCSDPDLASDMPDGASLAVETRGEEVWCIFTVPFADLAGLRGQYSDGLTINRLEIVDDVLYYDVTADLGEEGFGEAAGLGVDVIVLWNLTLPGSITTHNASSVSGNTLTWDLSTATQSLNMQAQSDLSGGDMFSLGTSIYYVAACCLCLLVLAAAGAGVFFFVRRRKPSGPDAAAEA